MNRSSKRLCGALAAAAFGVGAVYAQDGSTSASPGPASGTPANRQGSGTSDDDRRDGSAGDRNSRSSARSPTRQRQRPMYPGVVDPDTVVHPDSHAEQPQVPGPDPSRTPSPRGNSQRPDTTGNPPTGNDLPQPPNRENPPPLH